MQEKALSMSKELPPGSFAQVFWENQLQTATVKDAKSMRWDPIMIRWCLYLRHLSGGAYDMIRDAAVVKLPSQRDYTYICTISKLQQDSLMRYIDNHLVSSAKQLLTESAALSSLWMKCMSERTLFMTKRQAS